MFALGNATFTCIRSASGRSLEETRGETEVGRRLLAPEPRPLPPQKRPAGMQTECQRPPQPSHSLVELLEPSIRIGFRFCPLEYIRVMSKELQRQISGCKLATQRTVTASEIICPVSISSNNFCYTATASYVTCDINSPESANEFIQSLAGSHVLIFTDGSVFNGPVGSGACAAVLFPVSDTEDIQTFTNAVGNKVSSFDCEVAGIHLGINTAIDYFRSCQSRRTIENVYVYCHCSRAIDAVVNISSLHRYPDTFRSLQFASKVLHDISVVVHLINIPAHSGIHGNDTADKLAREVAHKISIGMISAPNVISVSDAYRLPAEIARKSWQRKWSEDSTGRYTYQLIPSVGVKVVFPLASLTADCYFMTLC